MLVNAHDLAAMGAAPVGALDALGARDAEHAERVLQGLRAGSQALDLPILGGHTQLGVGAALSVTALGRTTDPVPASGGRAGDAITVTADVAGGWRPGYDGPPVGLELGPHARRAAPDARRRAHRAPAAAKDVSMAGIVGTVGMLAEASGCGADLDVAAIPRPAGAALGDWLTCFPGFAMVTVDDRSAACPSRRRGDRCALRHPGRRPGVRLRWPDGAITGGGGRRDRTGRAT